MINFYEHIEDYLEGKLTPKESTAFAQAIKNDSDLEKAVEHYNIAADALDMLIEDDIRSVIAEIQVDSEEASPNVVQLKPKPRRLLIRIAASVILLVIGYFSLNTYVQRQYSHQAILDEYYIPPANPNATRSDTFKGPPIEEAMYLFDLRRFEESKAKFEEVLESTPSAVDQEIIHFYIGNIDYIKNDINTAKDHFLKTSDQRKFRYLAQIYYLEGNLLALKELYEIHPSTEIQELLERSGSWMYKWAK